MIFHLGEAVRRGLGVTGTGQLYLCPTCAKHEAQAIKENGCIEHDEAVHGPIPYLSVSKQKRAVCAYCGRMIRQRLEEEPRTRHRQSAYEIWRSRQDHDPLAQEIKRRIRESLTRAHETPGGRVEAPEARVTPQGDAPSAPSGKEG